MSYVKTKAEVDAVFDAMSKLDYRSNVLVAEFSTEAKFIENVLPPCFEPPAKPVGYLAFIQESVGFTNYLGVSLNIAARFGGIDGWYHLAMMYNTEFAVTIGRELLGECKKLADISFAEKDGLVLGSAIRHETELMSVKGHISEEVVSDQKLTTIFDIRAGLSPDARQILNHPTMLIKRRESQAEKAFTLTNSSFQLRSSTVDPCGSIPITETGAMTYFVNRKTQETITEVDLEDPQSLHPYILARNFDFNMVLGEQK